MYELRPLEVLFLTNFSDSCYRSIPALAQIADELAVRITILHAYSPAKIKAAEAELRVHSFFPEADHFGICRRLVMEGELLGVVENYCKNNPVDLIFAPASDPWAKPRLGFYSIRHNLLRKTGIPVWTIGPKVKLAKLNSAARNVACWINFDSPDKTHLRLAFEYAWKLDATLHLLHVLPEINEGSIALSLDYNKLLHPKGAVEEMRKLLGWVPIRPEIHVSHGDSKRAMVRLLHDIDADVLFMGKGHAIQSGLFVSKLHPLIDKSSCPIVCVEGHQTATPNWKLDRGPAQRPEVASSFGANGLELKKVEKRVGGTPDSYADC